MVMTRPASDATRARVFLALMTETLDRERPRWRSEPGSTARGPRDDRDVMRRLAVGALRLRFTGAEPLHLHPELLSTATDAEIELLATSVDAPGGQSSGVRAMRRLRRLSAALRAVVAEGGVPFALQLRHALDRGSARELVTSICDAGDSREAVRFLAVLAEPMRRTPEVERFFARLPLDPETEVADDLRYSARTTDAFTAGTHAICGVDPACGRCALAAAGLCMTGLARN